MQAKFLSVSVLLGIALAVPSAYGSDDPNSLREQAIARAQATVEQNIGALTHLDEEVSGSARFDVDQALETDKDLLKEFTGVKKEDIDLQVAMQNMAEKMSKNTQVLTALLNKVPQQALQGLLRAIEVSSHGEKVAHNTLDSIAKGETPNKPVAGNPNQGKPSNPGNPGNPGKPDRPDIPDRPNIPGRP